MVRFLDATAPQHVILKASLLRLSYLFLNSHTWLAERNRLMPISDSTVMGMGLHCDTVSHSSIPELAMPAIQDL